MKKIIFYMSIYLSIYFIAFATGFMLGKRVDVSKCEYTSSDVETVQNYYLEKIILSDTELERLDANNDNEVDLFDAVLIQKELNKTGC